jgi:lysophospholipase L1-like esterase
MNFSGVERKLLAALLLALLTAAVSAEQSSVKKKHPAVHKAPEARQKSGTHTRGAKGEAHSKTRLSAKTAKMTAARRAELQQEIATRLKEPESRALSNEAALDGFFAQLASQEAARQNGEAATNTIRALQWGDSHTAADMFTGEARRVFQEKFGNGGIGYAYAGRPFLGYRILGSRQSQSTGWKTSGTHFTQLGEGILGMGGISISTERPGEWVRLEASCTALDLQFLKQPGGGSIQFTDNGGEPVTIATAADELGAGTFHYSCPAGEHRFEVTTMDHAPVTLLGWVARQPGVTWESIGINGAEAPLILRWNQPLYAAYLKDNSPALVVLAYGTNEAASHAWDEESYRQTFARLIDTIHDYVPEASILVLGPSDRATRQHRTWQEYSGTDRIIRAQKAACKAHGCAYWNQFERMGGAGSMLDWAAIGWAQGDHTHFTGEGYRALADAMMADLMNGFEEYKKRQLPARQSPAEADQGEIHGSGSSHP